MAPVSSKLRLANEEGQAAVLFAILCGVLIVAVAMVSNMGKVVTEKMAMQNAVDLAAYSGAATEAGYLNEMRQTNEEIWTTLKDTRTFFETSNAPGDPIFFDPTNTGCGCPAAAAAGPLTAPAAEGIRDGVIAALEGMGFAERGINAAGYAAGMAATMEAAEKNYPGTGGHVRFYDQMSGGGMIQVKAYQVELTYKGWCLFVCPPAEVAPIVSLWDTHDGDKFDGWLYKQDRGDAAIAIGIEGAAPVSHFMDLDGDGYFTPQGCDFGTMSNGRCSLDVYSVAAPYFGKLGSIENGQAMWEMEPMYNNDMNPMDIDGASLLDDAEPQNNHYKDYKVRFVGIWESQYKLAGSGQSVKNAVPIGMNPLTAH